MFYLYIYAFPERKGYQRHVLLHHQRISVQPPRAPRSRGEGHQKRGKDLPRETVWWFRPPGFCLDKGGREVQIAATEETEW